ncbi:hypothetical protein [Runella aurantiaca]|jgi:hypothetical protein|uniref:Uncharacterized protein n=1 Tax=Runella aurantiaca TaxID=2282308 RepID=A0A369IDZ4_9BACT|nr:hypothetical protein [Runella aurantiaca]RDB05723.1 hypothetical protein DVG78_12065 [Runella aurantiaca]
MKTVFFAVLLSTTAILTCSDTSAQSERPAALRYFNECRVSETVNCAKRPTKVSVKDLPSVGCAIPLGQLAKLIEANQTAAK